MNKGSNFSKTKILCTLGPATNSYQSIKNLMEAGMDGVRLNFSHGNYDFYKNIFTQIHLACVDESQPLAILLDLQGPKIRIGELKKDEVEIKTGDEIEITANDISGDEKKISTSYKLLAKDAKVGDPVLIDDGLIRLRITKKRKNSVLCKIENGGILKPRKGMNLPGMDLSAPSLSDKDKEDLQFALNYRIDYIALSFVRNEKDIINLKEVLKEEKKNIPIIAKIEKKEAVNNFESILKAADGIMVARGDLGVELPPQDVPIIQKHIIKKCNEVGKLVITATQMLETMVNNPIPTRAEASDVANAVWDGTDVVMLSAETSVGKYPIKTVEIMNDIIFNTEKHINPRKSIQFKTPDSVEENLFDSVGRAIVSISEQVNAAAIVVFTFKGRTAKNLSKYRPDSKIIAISDSFDTMNNLCLRRGVTSVFMKEINKEHIAIDNGKKIILEAGLVKEGDIIILTAGAPISEKSRDNWLRFEVL